MIVGFLSHTLILIVLYIFLPNTTSTKPASLLVEVNAINFDLSKVMSVSCSNIQFVSFDITLQSFVGAAFDSGIPLFIVLSVIVSSVYSWITVNATTGECKQTPIQNVGASDIVACKFLLSFYCEGFTFDNSAGNLYYYNMPNGKLSEIGSVSVRTGKEGTPVPMVDYFEIMTMEWVN